MRFEEPGFDALGLVLHEVAHRLDLTLCGEDLAVVGHALTRDDLRCMGFGGGHRLLLWRAFAVFGQAKRRA